MKKPIEIIFFCFLTIVGNTQNVGIGTLSPQYPLDVAGRMRIKLSQNESSGLRLDGPSQVLRSFIGSINDDHIGIFGYGGAGYSFAMNVNNGNIGMGSVTPAFKLDLNGRMRIRQDTSTAGIWFDGSSSPTRSLMGTINDNYVGIFGNGGAGWNFAMEVNNGNIGIGTSSPTSRLDINGTLRLRSNSPVKGSVLTSVDNNGNAVWANPESFKTGGTFDGVPFTIDNITWTKVFFNQSMLHNFGNGYLPNVSEFSVLVKGLYHFKTAVTFLEKADKHSIRIRLKRNGVTSTIGEKYHQGFMYHQSFFGNYTGTCNFDEPATLSVQADLLPGDRIWVEAYIQIYTNGGTTTSISQDLSSTWFSGSIIARN
ncbi:MAG: hypothetical protein IPG79_05575 [Saprospiraceae bacterium]|nr:hypothetical protein [Saprospiraceae bacterium]MBK7524199.1 hypothetical protein [Saprospiraceae bacterium]MBK8855598.1 hypothetical protein [Saprospiraceae bacterium]